MSARPWAPEGSHSSLFSVCLVWYTVGAQWILTEFLHSEKDQGVLGLGWIFKMKSSLCQCRNPLCDILGGCSAGFTSSARNIIPGIFTACLLCTGMVLGCSGESRRYRPCIRKPAIVVGALSLTGIPSAWQLSPPPMAHSQLLQTTSGKWNPLSGDTSISSSWHFLHVSWDIALGPPFMRRCRCLSPSFHFELSFSHHWTSPKPPACGYLPVPMATLTFRTVRLMLGPGTGGSRWHSYFSWLGRKKAAVTCLVYWPPGGFYYVFNKGSSTLSSKSQCIPAYQLENLCLKLELRKIWVSTDGTQYCRQAGWAWT